MMGSWKSTVGKKLSKILGMKFVDTDDALCELTKLNMTEIFDQYGEKKFREMESSLFIEINKVKNQIISTGGGMTILEKNQITLNQNGTTILLQAQPETISKRIHNFTKRPTLNKNKDLLLQLKEIWKKRKKSYYDSANHIIETDDLNPEETSIKIIDMLSLNESSLS